MEQIYVYDLYESVKDLPPYKITKSWTNCKDFTPSYPKKQTAEFIPETLKQIKVNIKFGGSSKS